MWLFDYYVWVMLNNKFMMPAKMMARGAEMEKLSAQFGLNKFKIPTICKQ